MAPNGSSGIVKRSLGLVLALFLILGVATLPSLASDSRGQPITFQAEVSKMLDILVNSLYTTRAIFLRELISNGSDALDKARVTYLTSPKDAVNKDGVAPTQDIRISFDHDNKQLVIRDGGVGMTKEELSNHLGSLGTSGTKRFLEKMQESQGNTNNLIGQFGVGFYSVFLVGDKVTVTSKSDDSEKQFVWESKGDGQFYLYEDERGNTLGRGTEIRIDLKPDAMEFLDVVTIKETIHQYSEFINFPIYVEEAASKDEKKDTSADEEGTEEGTEEGEMAWTLVNKNRPIWTRSMTEVGEDEYFKFYKALTSDYKDPMYYSHFRVEGEVEFDSILFIPKEADISFFTEIEGKSKNIKLYVRRVFITDEFRDLLPKYLAFVKGVVDSNDLPLNVSREVLQESRILRVIKKKLVRKTLAMFADIAAQDEHLAKDGKSSAAVAGTKLLTEPTYERFWENYGKHLRLGVIQDATNRGRLTKLLRYKSSMSKGAYISLQTYLDRMREGQKGIYYLSGDSLEKIKQSPLLQDAKERKVEVLFMTDAIDEYVVQQLPDFAGKKLINLAKEGVVFEDTDAKQRIIAKKRQEKYKDFFNALLDLFGRSEVRKVVLTNRLTKEAFIVSSVENQMTARLANIVRGQAMAFDGMPIHAERVLEINHRHPLVDEIFKRFAVDPDDSVAQDIAWVLYDTANMQAEFPMSSMSKYAGRVNRLLRSSVDLAADGSLLPADDDEFSAEDPVEDDQVPADEVTVDDEASDL